MFNQNVLSIVLWRRQRLILDLASSARPFPAPLCARLAIFVMNDRFLRDGTDIFPTTPRGIQRRYILIRAAHYSPRNVITCSR